LASPEDLIDSGAALLHSPAWTQMMADHWAADHRLSGEGGHQPRPPRCCAMERTGAIAHIRDLPPELGRIYQPEESRRAITKNSSGGSAGYIPNYSRKLIAKRSGTSCTD